MKSPIVIDFEYNNSTEPKLNLVCCSFFYKKRFEVTWLESDEDARQELKDILYSLREHPFVAYNAIAEAQSFIALGLNPRDFMWIDIQIEYKMLINSDHTYEYGDHKVGKEKKYTTPPLNKYRATEAEIQADEDNINVSHANPSTSLVSAVYKILRQEIDSEEKDLMRDIIIAGGPFEGHIKNAIMDYCISDVRYLRELFNWFNVTQFTSQKMDQILWRGRTAANCAIISSTGYPISVEKIKNFRRNIIKVENELYSDIASQFPTPFVTYMPKAKRWKKSTKVLSNLFTENYSDRLDIWPKTKKGALSYSSEAMDKLFNYKHDFPRNNVAAQWVRLSKFESSIKSIKGKNKDGKDILSYTGRDERVRPYLNPYGAQTSRFQPPATQFLFLKSAWLRSLCEPKEGRAIIGIDYSSQEFLLQACVSGDEVMYESYKTGDVYMDFGKRVGLIPEHLTKSKAKLERAIAKSAVLGIGYGMGDRKLAFKIGDETGKQVTQQEARKLIDGFYNTYWKYWEFKRDTYQKYKEEKVISLPDGWKMWEDNDSKNSVLNFPLQGIGAAIMRKAIDLCLDRNLSVIFPLHDALYVECDLSEIDRTVMELSESMLTASEFYFSGVAKEWAKSIRLDCDVWGLNLEEGNRKINNIPCKFSKIYLDDRGESEYKMFSKYFNKELEK